MNSGSRPAKKECSAMMRSRFSMTVFLPYGPDFLRNVDSHRAPGNAAPAAHTSRSAELVDPRRQLVGHPLAVTSFAGSADAASVDIGKTLREARIQTAPALGMFASNIGYVFDRGAETRGADHGAVGAGQAAGGNVVPAWMLEILVEQIFDALSVDASALLAGRPVHRRFGLMPIRVRRWRSLQFG